jgi:hypothetical protein
MMKQMILLVFCLFWAVLASAQINESDTLKFQIRLSANGNYQTGNVVVFSLRNRLDFSVSPVKNGVFKSQNSSLYQAFYGKKADNDLFSRNYLYFKPNRQMYPFAIAYVSSNFRRRIDLRYFAGAGLTWQIIHKTDHVLKVSASAVHELTLFKGNQFNETRYNGSDKIQLWRGTCYLGGWHYLWHRRIRIYYDAFWQPGFNNSKNYRTQADVGVDFQIWKGLSFNALYTYTHENVVIQKVLEDDKILTFGLSYRYNLHSIHSKKR